MKDMEGKVVLYFSIGKNNFEITQKLLESGANPNSGSNVLDWALFRSDVEIIKTLIMYGAKVTQPTFGFTTLQGDPEIVQIMLDHGADLKNYDILDVVVSRGHLEVLKVLLKHGVDLNRYTCIHRVPLHNAIGKNRPEIVSELLKNGANPYLPDFSGITPIHYATKFPCDLKVFLNLGLPLDLNIRNNNEETVLETALRRGWKDTAKMIFHHNHNKF